MGFTFFLRRDFFTKISNKNSRRFHCPATTKAFHDPSCWWLLILVELYAARAATKNWQEGMRVETACYICICIYIFCCQGWLVVPSWDFLSDIVFLRKRKWQGPNTLLIFFARLNDYDSKWSSQIWCEFGQTTTSFALKINHAAATGPPQWTVVMIHVTSSDLWRIWATLRWIQTFLPAKLY